MASELSRVYRILWLDVIVSLTCPFIATGLAAAFSFSPGHWQTGLAQGCSGPPTRVKPLAPSNPSQTPPFFSFLATLWSAVSDGQSVFEANRND